MIKTITLIRPGMTAIAAVFALSAIPVLAQDAAPQTASPPTAVAPVQVTPQVIVPTEPTTASPTVAAPAPVAPVIVLPNDVVPAAPIVVEEAPAAPVARTAEPASARPAARQVSRPRTAAIEAAPIAAQPVETPAPAEITAAPAPVEITATPTETAPVTTEATANSDMLLLGGAGLAVLALGAAGFALSRRRRRDDVFAEAEPAVAYEPQAAAPVAEPDQRPAFAYAPVASDDAGEGRHVQAAYAGPTEENPFVSLKKRLKRAHFLDMQEARGVDEPAPQAPAFAASPSRYEERRFDTPKPRTPAMRPAFQY